MDFKGNVAVPFYMAYPWYLSKEGENSLMKDMDYFQETYPTKVKKYSKKISDIIDKLDYEGSMIYDEYPDKFSIERMAKNIADIIYKGMESDNESDNNDEKNAHSELDDLIQVLLCNEIYKRRHKMSKRKFYF